MEQTSTTQSRWRSLQGVLESRKAESSEKLNTSPNPSGKRVRATVIKVLREDSMKVAEVAVQYKYNTLLVNTCSDYPEEALRNGTHGVKYEIFRRSDLFTSINRSQFPLGPDEVVLTPRVTLMRDGLGHPCKERTLAVLLTPSIKGKTIITKVDDRYCYNLENEEQSDYLFKLLNTIFLVASQRDISCVVMDCLGIIDMGPITQIVDIINNLIPDCGVEYLFIGTGKSEKNEIFQYFHQGIIR